MINCHSYRISATQCLGQATGPDSMKRLVWFLSRVPFTLVNVYVDLVVFTRVAGTS